MTPIQHSLVALCISLFAICNICHGCSPPLPHDKMSFSQRAMIADGIFHGVVTNVESGGFSWESDVVTFQIHSVLKERDRMFGDDSDMSSCPRTIKITDSKLCVYNDVSSGEELIVFVTVTGTAVEKKYQLQNVNVQKAVFPPVTVASLISYGTVIDHTLSQRKEQWMWKFVMDCAIKGEMPRPKERTILIMDGVQCEDIEKCKTFILFEFDLGETVRAHYMRSSTVENFEALANSDIDIDNANCRNKRASRSYQKAIEGAIITSQDTHPKCKKMNG